jgi:chitinase domain-containing protein 1
MYLPGITILSLFISYTYASSHFFSHPACHLDPVLQRLSTQKLDASVVLKAASHPGSCSPSEQQRYEHPEKLMKLAYVTPWNGHGYDLAKWFASKLTHISPVWYQLTMVENSKPELRGGHDVDEGWLNEIRGAYRPPKIVPRVQLQLMQKVAEAILYFPQGEAEAISDILITEVEKYGYDGITLEMPAPHMFTTLIQKIGDALHDIEKEFVLVLPPQHTAEQAGMVFGADHLTDLVDEVDYFSVMTYDHAGALQKAGPNSPLQWMREVVEGLLEADEDEEDEEEDFSDLADKPSGSRKGSKILMGLPFYGYRFYKGQAAEACTASYYLDIMRMEEKTATLWDEATKEHMVVVGADSLLWYPSLLSLLYRLQLAEELGVGISIWEIGQGLDQFVDVL